jgi:tetratricopeptide (TPR) repeat protein
VNKQVASGLALIQQGDIEKALAHFELLVESHPTDHLSIYYIGLCYLKLDKVSTSLIHFDRALSLAPDTVNYLSDRAVAKLRVKDKQGSMNDLNRCVELDPNYSYRYSLRAFIRNSFGDAEGAIIDYKKAIELDPEDSIALNNLGMCEEAQGYKSSAQRRFEAADQIEGINSKSNSDHTIKFNSGSKPEKVSPKPSYWSTIKSVFTNAEQRAEFFKFTSSLLRGKKGDVK